MTRPERCAEFGLARRQLAKILREGSMCSVCTHREPNNPLRLDVCQSFGRSYPLCTRTPGLQFDPDHQRLQGANDAPSQ